jgi:putative FmdB family regulatory protein
MPIYEYRCAACNRRSSVLVRSMTSAVRPKCEHCGSSKLSRLMSKFAVRKGSVGSDGLDDLGGMDDVDENDPRSVARWARRMREESGEDLGPEFDQMIDRIEAGESPEDVMGGEGNLDGDDGFDDDDF